MKKILFLFPYPHGTAGSQRFRFEQYLEFLSENGFSCELQAFLDEKTWNALYQPGHTFAKITGILRGCFRRLAMLFWVNPFDFVFIHREAAPLGPPFFEWMIAKVFRKKIIFDFDDAIWLTPEPAGNRLANRLKWSSKTPLICRWAYRISAGNAYLADFARQHNPQVILNPTTLDTEHWHNQIKNQLTQKCVIGWTGTHSTLPYLLELLPVIRELEQDFDFTFLVISNRNPGFELRSFVFLPWRKETETEDLLQFNIGVMPLPDDAWTRGKCGFKALQYMALGIPAVVSPVAVNMEIVKEGENGFLCQTPQAWKQRLTELLQDADLREKLGKKARQTIVERYSVQANCRNFLNLFA
jgi:glycosyltransferase involved in cell wall biosynthesis